MQTENSFFYELSKINDELRKDDHVDVNPRKKGRAWTNNFYSNWQEAAAAAMQLGIDNYPKYKKLYKQDNRLPCKPDQSYADFPGWIQFFGRQKKNFYPTWQEAAEAARRLGIKRSIDYYYVYKGDGRLPSNPGKFYSDFPGFKKFLGKDE